MRTLLQNEQQWLEMARVADTDTANSTLLATGWFAELNGPHDEGPVLMNGKLKTGEEVYFRANSYRARLQIYRKNEERPVRVFSTKFELQEEGVNPPMTVLMALIQGWLAEYKQGS